MRQAHLLGFAQAVFFCLTTEKLSGSCIDQTLILIVLERYGFGRLIRPFRVDCLAY